MKTERKNEMTFKPTHRITRNGTHTLVMLIDGAAYTELEASSLTHADYECTDDLAGGS